MDRMKADMAGGAAIIGALRAVLDLDLAVAIDIILPIVENMPGGGAMRPGDVITTYSGQTVEVLNTDAEGRLILADALAFAKTLNPRYVVDLATLTGASAIVFGPYGIGTFVNDASLRQSLFAADRLAGERLWQLPLWPEYLDLMRSGVADLANISKTVQKGSMMTAASFLRTFIEPVPWAHLDIYNSAWSELDHPVFGKGPTGAGVATLVELLVAMSNAGT
jgi:leucyl aminopeptidase